MKKSYGGGRTNTRYSFDLLGFLHDLRSDHDIHHNLGIFLNFEWPRWRVWFDVPQKSSRLSIWAFYTLLGLPDEFPILGSAHHQIGPCLKPGKWKETKIPPVENTFLAHKYAFGSPSSAELYLVSTAAAEMDSTYFGHSLSIYECENMWKDHLKARNLRLLAWKHYGGNSDVHWSGGFEIRTYFQALIQFVLSLTCSTSLSTANIFSPKLSPNLEISKMFCFW